MNKKNEGINSTYKKPALDSKNEEIKEGINISNNETALAQENHRNKINYEGIGSNYKELAWEPENSENEAHTEGIIISNEEQSLEQENSKIEAKYMEINSTFKLVNSEIGAKKERMSSIYKKPNLNQDISEVTEKRYRSSSSYEEQMTKHLYASNTHKKVGGQNLLFLRTTR